MLSDSLCESFRTVLQEESAQSSGTRHEGSFNRNVRQNRDDRVVAQGRKADLAQHTASIERQVSKVAEQLLATTDGSLSIEQFGSIVNERRPYFAVVDEGRMHQ